MRQAVEDKARGADAVSVERSVTATEEKEHEVDCVVLVNPLLIHPR